MITVLLHSLSILHHGVVACSQIRTLDLFRSLLFFVFFFLFSWKLVILLIYRLLGPSLHKQCIAMRFWDQLQAVNIFHHCAW